MSNQMESTRGRSEPSPRVEPAPGARAAADSPVGVLLVNLGSPDSPTVGDVRRYLNEFLMDGYVIDVPFPIRKLIVGGFILPFRPKHSAAAYKSIWWDEGSPLIVISENVHRLLAERMDVPVELAMRYGNPSVTAGLRRLAERCGPSLREVFVVALYPHYAMATIQSSVEAVEKAVHKMGLGVTVKAAAPFFDDEAYIEALAESAREYLEKGYDHLLVSYHGLPERHLKKTDPTGAHCLKVEDCCNVASRALDTCYRHQVLKTTELFAKRLNIPRDKYSVSFQSRLGRDAWLQPATVDEVDRLAAAGIRNLKVICPAFVSDCLETLEEIGIGIRERFLEAGGESFEMIPCMNDHPKWIEALHKICSEGINGPAARS